MTATPSEKKVEKAKESLPVTSFAIPLVASIQDILRATKVLSDSGGQARWGDIMASFGTKSSEKNILNCALNSAVAFELIQPHKKKASYVLSEDGKKLLSSQENLQKTVLMEKFLRFEGYRKILVAIKNNKDNQLKKQTITEMWSQIRDGLKLNTRQAYTFTFSSVGVWCGALTDTGQTCLLTPEAQTILTQILEGDKGKEGILQSLSSSPPKTSTTASVTSGSSVVNCPHCGKMDVAVENEELLQTLSSAEVHTLIIKSTYYCRGCSRTFSAINQRPVRMND
jgi:hypothetical protein